MSRPASESLGAVHRTRTVSSCADSVERTVFPYHDPTQLLASSKNTQQQQTTNSHNNNTNHILSDENNNIPSTDNRSRKRVRLNNQTSLDHHRLTNHLSKSILHQQHANLTNSKNYVMHSINDAGGTKIHNDRPPGNDNPTSTKSTTKNSLSRSKSANSSNRSKQKYTLPSKDDAEGHLMYQLGEGLAPDLQFPQGRYKILSDLGEGTFGKVLECWDRKERQHVAIKVVRSVNKYREAARLEINILFHLRTNDPKGCYHCVKLYSWFDYLSHVCLVFEKLGPSLYEKLRRNNFRPFPLDQVRKYAHQLLQSINFVHSLTLIHTDLKPENILLSDSDATKSIKLIDFGSATFEQNHHSAVISTRHYRAPEVILGLGWTYPCDLWSIGCILVELYTGKALFQTHENLEHLAMMSCVLGPIPQSMIRKAHGFGQKYFSKGQGGHNCLNWPAGASSRESIRTVHRVQSLQEIIFRRDEHANFLDLVRRLLAFDPETRCTSAEALQHPFFHEVSLPPDPPFHSPAPCEKQTRSLQRKRTNVKQITGRKRPATTMEKDIEGRGAESSANHSQEVEDEGDDTATEMQTGAEHSDHTIVVAPISPQNRLPEGAGIS